MDDEAFLRMIHSADRTKSDLMTIRANATAKGLPEFVRVTEQMLDSRFPGWRSPPPVKKPPPTATPASTYSIAQHSSRPNGQAKRSDLIAIMPPLALLDKEYSKQVLLLFDRIAVDLGTNGLPIAQHEALHQQKEFQWLRENGLLTTVGALIAEKRDRITTDIPIAGMDLMGDVLGKGLSRALSRSASLTVFALEGLRHSAATLRKMYALDAILVSPDESLINLVSAEKPDEYSRRDMVFRVTLSEFPMPAPDTNWAPILDFKTTLESQRYMSLLRQWINKTSSRQAQQYEIRDELRELQFQYEESLRLHKVKSTTGTLEVLVTVAAEVAEDLVRFKFGDAAKAVFSMKREHVKLIEAEMSAPGREVAYIVRARQRFQR